MLRQVPPCLAEVIIGYVLVQSSEYLWDQI